MAKVSVKLSSEQLSRLQPILDQRQVSLELGISEIVQTFIAENSTPYRSGGNGGERETQHEYVFHDPTR